MKKDAILYSPRYFSVKELAELSHLYDLKYVCGKRNDELVDLPYKDLEGFVERERYVIIVPDILEAGETKQKDVEYVRVSDAIAKSSVSEKLKTGIIGNRYYIHLEDKVDFDKVDFNIHLDGKYITTVESAGKSIVFELKENGLYYCRAVAFKDGQKFSVSMSNTYEYYANSFKEEFDFVLDRQSVPDKLKYIESKAPFYDICMVVDKENNTHKIYSKIEPQILDDGTKIYYSGVIKLGERLFFSPERLKIRSKDELKENVGSYFVIAEHNSGNFEIFNDYFGQEKIYYFNTNKYFICSNRYHQILLEIMKRYQTLSLNNRNVLIGFSNTYAHFAENPINCDMNVRGVHYLPIDESVNIDTRTNKICKDYKQIKKDLEKPTIKIENYKEEILKVKDELVSNIKAALNTENITRIVSDLSGGLDSRLLLGILTNINETKKRVKIRTLAFPSETDLNIATTIADKLGYEYDFELDHELTLKESDMPYSIEEILQIADSTQLGSYFGFSELIAPRTNSENTLELWGVMGEAITRPYITGENIDKWKQEEDEKVLSEYWHENQRWITADYDKVGHLLLEEMLKQMKQMANKKAVEKMELFYLKYRNRFHCDIGMRRGYRVLQWNPLSSPLSLKLFHATFEMFYSNKYAFDLLYSLNPEIVDYEYSSKKYNQDQKQLKGQLIYVPKKNTNPIVKSEKYLSTKKKYLVGEKRKINFNFFEYSNIKDMDIFLLCRMMPYLKIVMDYEGGIFKDAFGYNIWNICKKIIEGNRDEILVRKFRVLYRKIISLGNEIIIISEDKKG